MSAKTPSEFTYPAAGIPCPSCGAWLWADTGSGTVGCRCGFAADRDTVRELAYLRHSVPLWTARLAALEQSLDGQSVPPPLAPRAPGVSPEPGVAHMRVSAAYGVLVTLGALLVVAGVLALTVVLWEAAGPLGQAALMATVAVLVAVVAILIRERIPATANALAVIAVLVWLAFAVLAMRSLVGLDVDEPGWTLALLSTAAWTALAGRQWGLAPWRLAAAVCTPLAFAMGVVLVAERLDGGPALAVAAAVEGLLVVALVGRAWGLPTAERVVAAATAALAAVVIAVASLVESSEPATFAALIAGLLVLAAACMLAPRVRSAAPPLAGLAVGLTAGLGWSSIWPSAALVAAAAGCALLLLKEPWGYVTAAASGSPFAVLAAAFYSDGEERLGWAYVLVLATIAIGIGVRAVRERRIGPLLASLAAAALAVLFSVALLSDVEAPDDWWLEQFTVPLAVVLAAYGLLARWLKGDVSSLWTLGPGVAMLLLPSALVGVSDADPARLYWVLAAALLVLVAGLASRLAGLVVPSAIALVIVAVRPLSLLFEWMPSWVVYTAAGVVLLVIGARFEHVRSRAVSVRHWAQGRFR